MAKSKVPQSLLSQARQKHFTGRDAESGRAINLAGNYDYLSQAYYVSQDFENDGRPITPTCREMLDAYVPPIFLEKARLAGINVPEYYISNGYFEPPAIVDPINPFTLKGKVVLRQGRTKSIARSLTRNFTYAICCQVLPEGSRVAHFRSVLGWAVKPAFRELSKMVFETFGIPLARVRVICPADGGCLLSDIAPLFFEDLGAGEIKYLQERVSWDN